MIELPCFVITSYSIYGIDRDRNHNDSCEAETERTQQQEGVGLVAYARSASNRAKGG